jgi:shikimate dehydrogenase
MKRGYSHLKCGLIGKNLSHSFSAPIHNALADYSFTLHELAPEQVEYFVKNTELDAYCITIPYKKDVMPYLDVISPEAQSIGAVNVVVRKSDNKLYGYNTDYFGFDYMVKSSGVSLKGKKAVVFGRGGAAATIFAYLRDMGVRQTVSFGSKDNTPENLAPHLDAEIIVNASPVGMYPHNNASPCSLSSFSKCEAVFDLIYNPARTSLMIEAEKLGITAVGGISMLVAQAAKAFEHFTGDDYESGIIESIISDITAKSENLILIGMPGCGKSSVGKIVAELLGRDFLDSDEEFKKMHGISPADAIRSLGEEQFRLMETEVLDSLGKLSKKVIATGGGAVTKDRNYPLLHQNGVIVFLERALDKLATNGRPLSQDRDISKLYADRIDSYVRFSDIRVSSTEIKEKTADRIATEYIKYFKG